MPLNESGTLLRIDADVKGAKIYNTALDSAKQATDKFGKSAGKIIGVQNEKMTQSFDKSGNRITKWGGQFITASGKVVQASAIADKNGIRPLQTSVKNMADNSKKATGVMGDFTRALKRVLVVVPLWGALRTVISAVTSTLKEGAKAIIDIDKELQRVATTIELTGTNTSKVLKKLKDDSIILAKETGISANKIINAYFRFSTVGNTVEESFAGMNAAVKEAITLQGDVTDIAEINALVYKLLGKTLDENLSVQERQLIIAASTTKLFRDNAFTISEMTNSFRQFLPVANNANLSFSETIALLATLSSGALKGSKGGRLLKTSFIKIVKELKPLGRELGIFIEESDTSFETILKVVSALKKLGETSKGIPESFKKVAEIFGVRSALPIQALVAIEKTLKANIEAVNGSIKQQRQQISELETSYQRMLKSTHKIVEQNKILKSEIGRTFLEGITGAEDYKKALLTIQDLLKTLQVISKATGESINTAWSLTLLSAFTKFLDVQTAKSKALGKILGNITKGIKGDLTNIELEDLLGLLQNVKIKNIFKDAKIDLDVFTKSLENQLLKQYTVDVNIDLNKDKALNDSKKLANDIKETLGDFDLGKDFAEKLASIRAQSKRNIAELQQGDTVSPARIKLLDYTKDLVKEYNAMVVANKVNVSLLNEQEIQTKVLAGDFQEIANITKGNVFVDEALLKLARQRASALLEVVKNEQDILDIEQEIHFARLKAAGLSDIEIAKQKVIFLQQERGLSQDSLQVAKAIRDVELERLKVMSARIQQIKSVTQSAIKIGLEEGDIDSFLNKFREGIRETMIDSLASGLNESLFNMIGLGQNLGTVFATAEQTLPMAIDTSLKTGGDYVGLKITEALQGGVGVGGGAGGAVGAELGMPGFETKKVEDAVEKGTEKAQKKNFFNTQNFKRALGLGLLTFGLFGGQKSKRSINQRFSSKDAFTGATTGDATTRSTTRAKITNFKIENIFQIDGASLNTRQAVESFADKLRIIEKQMFEKLAQEGYISGEF